MTTLSPNLRAKTARFINPCLFVFPIGTFLSNKYASSRSSDATLEMMPPFRPIVLCETDLFNMAVNIRKMSYEEVYKFDGTVINL